LSHSVRDLVYKRTFLLVWGQMLWQLYLDCVDILPSGELSFKHWFYRWVLVRCQSWVQMAFTVISNRLWRLHTGRYRRVSGRSKASFQSRLTQNVLPVNHSACMPVNVFTTRVRLQLHLSSLPKFAFILKIKMLRHLHKSVWRHWLRIDIDRLLKCVFVFLALLLDLRFIRLIC